jgi:aminopeptidase N
VGSTLQLAAFQAVVATAESPGEVRGWLTGTDLPAGLSLDADLRWRLLVRLAVLGATGREELDAALAAEPTAKSRVEHARAVASLPDREAKAWAWARFTGEAPAANYELEACGTGLWRHGQEELTAPWVHRYLEALPGIAGVHEGWVLGTVTTAFFPRTAVSAETLHEADALLAGDGLDATVRRNLVDAVDDLRHLLAVRTAYPGGR